MSNVISFSDYRNKKPRQLASYKDWQRQGYIDFTELNFDKKITLDKDCMFTYHVDSTDLNNVPSNHSQSEHYQQGLDQKFNELVNNSKLDGNPAEFFYQLGKRAAKTYTVKIRLANGTIVESEQLSTNLKIWLDDEGIYNANYLVHAGEYEPDFARGIKEHLDSLQTSLQTDNTSSDTNHVESINWFSIVATLLISAFLWYFLYIVVLK